jgi:hypothetical protein
MARRTGRPSKQKPQPQPTTPQPAAYIGRWKLINEKGAIEMYLTVTESGAKKDHAPNFPGTWKVEGKDLRITWKDGFWDILRLGADSSMVFLKFGKNSKRWDGRPKSLSE